jgi:hypothetical protein
MPGSHPSHISDFVKSVMPDGCSAGDLIMAQRRLDDALDVIDQIHHRLHSSAVYNSEARQQDGRGTLE